MMPIDVPESTSCWRQSLRPPMRGRRKRLKPRAPAARIADQKGPRKRREKAISPTPMWTTLRASSPRVRAKLLPLHLAALAQPGGGGGQSLGERAVAVAELLLRPGGAVGPVVGVDVDQVGRQLRRGAAQLRPRLLGGAGGLRQP